jgi:hypothetical protein
VEDPRAQRLVTLGVIVVAAVIGVALVTLGPDRGARPAVTVASPAGRADAAATTTAPVTTTAAAGGVTTTAAPATTAPTTTAAGGDPGALPQTDEKPAASGATFDAAVQGLWQAIVQDDPQLAMPFFFPRSAYLQVKAISDPATDYQRRLIANYEEDIHSLHAQLGDNASSARYVGIDVPDGQAVLVQPGEESNKLSYWRVYGTMLQYSVDGATNSFPVTSLISWRGEWYVVHLGAIR